MKANKDTLAMSALKYERSLYNVSDAIFCSVSMFFAKARSKKVTVYSQESFIIQVISPAFDALRMQATIQRRVRQLGHLHWNSNYQQFHLTEHPSNFSFHYHNLAGSFCASVLFSSPDNLHEQVFASPASSYVILKIPNSDTWQNDQGAIHYTTKMFIYNASEEESQEIVCA